MSKSAYIKELNELFKRYNFNLMIKEEDLDFLKDTVIESLSGDRPFSRLLSRIITPPIEKGEFYHYTNTAGSNGILQSKILRITSILKRIEEDEILGFLEKFGLNYPLAIDPKTNGQRYKDSIAKQIFYTSFTETSLSNDEEQYFWNTFAGMDGTRLKFRLKMKAGCLRKIAYGEEVNKWAKFYREVNDITRKYIKSIFHYEDLGSICALHLPYCYNKENETRLIVRREWGLSIKVDRGIEYLELPFGENDFINLELIEIQTNNPVDKSYSAILIPRK